MLIDALQHLGLLDYEAVLCAAGFSTLRDIAKEPSYADLPHVLPKAKGGNVTFVRRSPQKRIRQVFLASVCATGKACQTVVALWNNATRFS